MKMNMDWETSLPLFIFLLEVKILEMCVTKLSKQNIWREIMQRHGKGGVLNTLPPPIRAKKASLIQGSEKRSFLKIVLSHKVATYEFIPFLFFSKVAEI